MRFAVMYPLDLPRGSTGFAWSYTGSYRIPSAMVFFILLLSLSWWNPSPVRAAAAITDSDEVASLQSIAKKMGFNLWDFSVDPCSGENGWNSTAAPYIACECTGSSCHVTELYVYNLNLVGEIPLQIMNLTHLKELTMGLNLFTGSIPIELGRLSALTKIDFGINQLSGSVPSELGNLTNLDSLGFGSNNLSGAFPKALGNLTRLTGLYMDGSGLSGELPVEFGELASLKNVWMFGNQFSGQIPDVFGNMSQLTEMRMYGNNFTGPIPSSILKLPSLVILSIGDLLDGGMIPSSFKTLQGLKYLSLRNNNLRGTIPEDLGSLNQLQYLDLSFNNLTGGIPTSFATLENLNTLFLGNNSLTGNLAMLGQVPFLMSLDVSNNQMSGPLPTWVNRSSLQANLLWNLFDQSNDKSRLVSAAFNCLDLDSPCDHTVAGKNLGFSINCGGPEVTALSTQDTYSADSETLGNASFFQSEAASWGVSNIGYQYDNDFATILSTTSIIQGTFDQALYKTARGAASSLRYYGIGMVNGAYNVELHFAEIAITADTTSWKSQGRRIFDVYIQGSRVLKDFDIHAAANGSFIAVVKNFSTEVTDTVLEVHFLWSGKGTCCSPTHWTYGPLISAIHVYADFHVPSVGSSSRRKVYVIVGAVLAGILIGFVIIITTWRKRLCKSACEACKGENQDYLVSSEFSSIEAKPHIFTYNELKAATEDFHVKNKLGEGGFGAVFKGTLLDGTVVAVKMLSAEAEKGNNEFMNEAATISAVQHRNLVKLLGCCVQGNHKILVFEFLENNSLSQTLLEKKLFLDWPTRFSICAGIARGLTYLHEESRTRIVHRDIKASNILLDQNLNPKIGDFGLAKLFQDNKTHISTRVAGTIGYLAPEYAFRGKLTEKADVYSFGILLLEIVSGRGSIDTSLPSEMVYLLEWTWELYEENRVVDLADASLEGKFSKRDVERVIQVSLLCTQAVAAVRPKMSEALSMLTGNLDINLNINRPGFLSDLRQFSLQQQNKPTPSNSTGTTVASSSTSSRPFYSHAQQSISQVEAR